jgi:glutathione reductase (NADPH)
MVFASEYREMFDDARAYGWDLEDGAFNWSKFSGRMRDELDRLEGIYRNLLTNAGVTFYDARAVLKDAHTVELSTGEVFTAKHILVSTGGHPTLPELANADLGITSNDIFLLKELPKSILIVGGGYIACEFAGILNGLGVQVTQYYRGAQILRGFDDEARGVVAEGMREKGVDLHVGTNIMQMEKRDGGIWIKSTTGRECTVDQVLFATGRTPNTAGLGLEEAGVEIGRWGEIVVDKYSQTNVPSIYAIGDVTNRISLTPVAIREGAAFAETVFKGNPVAPDHDLVPSAIFTQPEMATVGLSEEEARDIEKIEVYCSSFKPMQRSFAGRGDRALMKLVVSKETRKVLGCHIVSDHAGEMIQLVGIAIKMGATKEDFDRTVAVHPTISEELVTMKSPVRTT